MKTVLLSIPKSLNSTIEFIRNLVQVILELLLCRRWFVFVPCFFDCLGTLICYDDYD
jgi:hypothetical protein